MPHIFIIFIIVGSCFSIIGLRIYLPHLWAKESFNGDLEERILNPSHPPKFYKNFKTLSATMDQELPNYLLGKYSKSLGKKSKLIHPEISPSIFSPGHHIDKKKNDTVLLPLFSMLIIVISIIFAFILLFRPRTKYSKTAGLSTQQSTSQPGHLSGPTGRSSYNPNDCGPNWHTLATNLVKLFCEYKDEDNHTGSDQDSDDGSITNDHDDSNLTNKQFLGPARRDATNVDTTIRDLKALEHLLLNYRNCYSSQDSSDTNHDRPAFEDLIRRLNSSLNQILRHRAEPVTLNSHLSKRLNHLPAPDWMDKTPYSNSSPNNTSKISYATVSHDDTPINGHCHYDDNIYIQDSSLMKKLGQT